SARRNVCQLEPGVTVDVVHHPGRSSVYGERTKHATAAVAAKHPNKLVRGSICDIHARRLRLRLHDHALAVKTDNRVVAARRQGNSGLLCSGVSVDSELISGARIVLPGGKVECAAVGSQVATVYARDMQHLVP